MVTLVKFRVEAAYPVPSLPEGKQMIRMQNPPRHCFPIILALLVVLGTALGSETSPLNGRPYLKAVTAFAHTVLERGRDKYGAIQTPLFVDGLQVETLEPVRWQGSSSEVWVLSNFASQQPLMRVLDGLSAVTGDKQYREAAEAAARYVLAHLRSPSGLPYWGGHTAWDLQGDRAVGQQGTNNHELKSHQPYYELMWRIDPAATRQLLEAIWATHILDWERLDYNRHANNQRRLKPAWEHPFAENIPVPYPAKGENLSFVNVIPPLMHSGVMLATLGRDDNALTWTRRLVYRWQQGRDPKTGLCGGQLSYRTTDRAFQALGHVHPNINEAKIVATYHQTCRYHNLPLAQMQAGEELLAAGGRAADLGREFIRWAAEDLLTYARQCYDPTQGVFIARMTDGTPLDWKQSRKGYYIPESFAPQPPDGFLFWGLATAYRLTRNETHWQSLGQLARQFDLGELGQPSGQQQALRFNTTHQDWRTLYALLELRTATGNDAFLRLASRVADNLLATQTQTGLFPHEERTYARTGDEIPLALLHLAVALDGKPAALPRPCFDSRFFHCQYYGPLEPHQQKRADPRTYDDLVFYGAK